MNLAMLGESNNAGFSYEIFFALKNLWGDWKGFMSS
jgi:hypothetical protein